MDLCKRFWSPVVFLLACAFQTAAIGQPAASAGRGKTVSAADTTRQLADEDWLKTVWGQTPTGRVRESMDLPGGSGK